MTTEPTEPASRRRAAIVAGVLLLVAVAAVVIFLATRPSSSDDGAVATPAPRGLPGLLTSPAPWPANNELLRSRLEEIGLPALPAEGQVLHTHSVLEIVIDGGAVQVPPDVGIDALGRFIAPIHTHDGSGVIHVESPEVRPFTLGQFFDVWGVAFDARCLGAYCEGDGAALRVLADGEPAPGDPRDLRLQDGQRIEIVYENAV